MTKEQNCSDCGDELIRPHTENANYVRTDRHGDTVTVSKFEVELEDGSTVEVKSPEKAKNIDNVENLEVVEETVERKRTALICSECTKDSDEIIWGVDE